MRGWVLWNCQIKVFKRQHVTFSRIWRKKTYSRPLLALFSEHVKTAFRQSSFSPKAQKCSLRNIFNPIKPTLVGLCGCPRPTWQLVFVFRIWLTASSISPNSPPRRGRSAAAKLTLSNTPQSWRNTIARSFCFQQIPARYLQLQCNNQLNCNVLGLQDSSKFCEIILQYFRKVWFWE